MPTRICIIRHGETDWNVAKCIQGQTDIPLNQNGREQALAMAFHAAHYHFDAIYSSDLQRAANTAQAIADRLGMSVQQRANLRERHYGIFQGITAQQAAELHPAAHTCYKTRDLEYNFETGESLNCFAERVKHTFADLVKHHQRQLLAVVTHAGVLDVMYRTSTGRPLQTARDFVIPNCALNWFRFDHHGWHLEAWDDHQHLRKVQLEAVE